MTQDILATIIFISAILYAMYRFVHFILPARKTAKLCDGACDGCKLKNKAILLKKEIHPDPIDQDGNSLKIPFTLNNS